MTQPSFVPIVEADQVRRAYQLRVPSIWTQSRASELRGTGQPTGTLLGSPGPDQGFALKLARRFEDRLVLAPGESVEDAIAGCTAVAMRRSARFGRAPVVHDLTFGFTLWGFLGGAPADLVEARGPPTRQGVTPAPSARPGRRWRDREDVGVVSGPCATCAYWPTPP